MEEKGFLFADLSLIDFSEPKDVDCMAAGSFTDMWGREFVVEPEDLPVYVKNTISALESTRDSNGEVVGFPIDQRHHDGGDAAGFITGVFLEGGVIRMNVRWTEVGRELVETELERYFSPTFDLEEKVIIGGSLTNWPASRTKDHKILLRPVELSACLSGLVGEEPERNLAALGDYIKAAVKEVLDGLKPQPEKNHIQEEESMPEATLAELAADPANADYIASLREEVRTQERERVEAEMAAQLEAEKAHTALEKFADELIGGTDEKPFGLAIDRDELIELAEGLDPEKREKLTSMLEAVKEKKIVDFSEKGHQEHMNNQPLPEWAKASLQMWLDKGHELEAWFTANAVELGAMDEYDLSEFKKEK